MRKIKKSLSVLLALVMIICSFSAVTASALTNDAAQAEAEAYNAVERDFSAVMAGTTEKKAEVTANTVNKALLKLFESIDIKGAVYSDSVATTVIKEIAGILKNNIANSVDSNAVKADYPEVYEYLFTTCGGKWENVDVNAVNWGIKNRDDFAKVIGIGCRNFGDTLNTLVALAPMFGTDVYNLSLVPIVESLHVGKALKFDEFIKLGGGSNVMEYIANIICNVVDAFAADPIGYLTDVLPDFARTFDPAVATLNGFLTSFGAMLGLSISIPDFNGIIDLAADKIGLTLTDVDVNSLALMGTAAAAESGCADGYRVQVNGNKPVVFMALSSYVKENLAVDANQKVIGEIIVEKTGISSKEVFDELFDAVKSNDELTVTMEKLSVFIEDVADSIAQKGTGNAFLDFTAKVVKFFAMVSAKIFGFINKIFVK